MWQRITLATLALLLLGTFALTFVSRGTPVVAAQAQAPAAKHFLEEGKLYRFSGSGPNVPGKVLEIPKDNFVKVEFSNDVQNAPRTLWINLTHVNHVEFIGKPK